MTSFSAHDALVYIDDELAKELPFQRIDPPSRSKTQFFSVPPSGKQFALVVGDVEAATGHFGRKEVRIVLEALPDKALPDVEPLPADDVLNGSSLTRSFSRLKPPIQRSVVVASPSGLREVLRWYAGATTAPAATPSAHVKRATPHLREQQMQQPTEATNTILYGPPGTGKTYATSSRAVALCDGTLPDGVGQEAVLARYEELRAQGRILFVTFHQSYGYEEFVEGLRPVAGANGQVSYEVLPGAFRRICESAAMKQQVSPGLSGKALKDRPVYKMSLGFSRNEEGVKVFKYCVDNHYLLLGWGHDVDFTGCDDEKAIATKLKADEPNIEKFDSQVRFVHRFKNDLKVGDIVIISNGNRFFRGVAEVTGDYEFVEDGPFHQGRPVRWLALFPEGRPTSDINPKDFTMRSLHRLPDIDYEALQGILPKGQDDDTAPKPHVLIIDEINRANISKVFGELITLIEPDKRQGAANRITLKLPYSGEDFSVPSNVHLLGTMNTADRSIALLDTALRRRFDFEELLPQPSALRGVAIPGADIDLEKLLAALNDRVEALYDRDHTIGHAFFMGVKSLVDLERVFRRKVLPLLQEYFYERWADIRRVLNDSGDGDFVARRVLPKIPVEGDDAYEEEPRLSYAVNTASFPVAAYRRIYGA